MNDIAPNSPDNITWKALNVLSALSRDSGSYEQFSCIIHVYNYIYISNYISNYIIKSAWCIKRGSILTMSLQEVFEQGDGILRPSTKVPTKSALKRSGTPPPINYPALLNCDDLEVGDI